MKENMKRMVLAALLLVEIAGSASAQRDDLYFVPKKKVKIEAVAKESGESAGQETVPVTAQEKEPMVSAGFFTKALEMDEDAYNRRGSYVTEQGDAVAEFAMDAEGFVLITEEGDTMWMNTDTLKLTRVGEDEGWVNGFDGSDADYEYAMRIVRFRNPRYAIPVSSPLYWDVVYGGALWLSWDWNIYDDGLYAYVFPTASNWHYWDYRMGYPYGWSPWGGGYWNHHWGWHYGHHWGGFYGHVWYDPWYDPYCYGYYPGWHHGHHGFYPGIGKPGWGGGKPGSRPYENTRHATVASTRRGTQDDGAVARGTTSATRRDVNTSRTNNGSTRSSSVRVVTGRAGSSTSRSSGAVRSSSGMGNGDEMLRRGSSTSSSISRGAATGSSSRGSYTRQSSSRSGSSSSYNRPSSTRSSSSSISRSSSSSRSSGYSSGYSSNSSSSSSSSSRSSSYSGSSSYSSSSRSSSGSYSSGSSYSGGSRGGSSYSGGGSSRSGGSSGSRR